MCGVGETVRVADLSEGSGAGAGRPSVKGALPANAAEAKEGSVDRWGPHRRIRTGRHRMVDSRNPAHCREARLAWRCLDVTELGGLKRGRGGPAGAHVCVCLRLAPAGVQPPSLDNFGGGGLNQQGIVRSRAPGRPPPTRPNPPCRAAACVPGRDRPCPCHASRS